MDYTIRHYEKSDYINLGTLSNDEYEYNHILIAKSLKNSNDTYEKCFVAIVDNEIVAYIYGYVVPAKLAIPQFLYVKKTQRGKGIGAALLNHFECVAGTPSSLIYYRNELHDYYTKQGYVAGTLEVAMKQIPMDEETV